MSLHSQVVELVAKSDAVPRAEAHSKQFMCPVCTHDVKAFKVRRHVAGSHPEYAGALRCVDQAKSPRKLLAHAS